MMRSRVSPALDELERSLQSVQAFAALRLAIDDRVGLINSVSVLRTLGEDCPAFAAYASPCDTRTLAGIRAANKGGACAITRTRALVRACGEAVERYASSFFHREALPLRSMSDLDGRGERYVSPAALYPFSADQYADPSFPFGEAARSSPLRWVRAKGAWSGESVWVPASCVYVPYLFDKRDEPFTHMPISTGLAAGPSIPFCIEKGILEIVERDALMVSWNGRIPVPRIDLATCLGLTAEIDRMLTAFPPERSEWHINLLTLDVGIPVLSAALVDHGDSPRTSFGIAASADPVVALSNALEEALLSRFLLNRSVELASPAEVPPLQFKTLREHLLGHAIDPALRASLMSYLTGGGTMPFTAIQPAPLDALVFSSCGLPSEPLWVDVTTPDVADLDVRVVRTLIPGMQPLDNDHRYRYLGGQRLHGVGPKLGRAGTIGPLNPVPHPFP